MKKILLMLMCIAAMTTWAQNNNNVVDQVVWVVGDEPIFLSDVEEMRLGMEESRQTITNPYCTIPEQLAVQKLFLHQADIDSLYADEATVIADADEIMDRAMQAYGSREAIEAVFHKSYQQMREEQKRLARDRDRVNQVQRKLVSGVKVTPSEVRNYFQKLPQDSLPFVPEQVEVQIITSQPRVSRDEVERIENTLRDYAQRVNTGETEFATLARFYSQDEGSARNGGELGYKARGELVPEFANVAFSLNDPKKVSKIVKSEFGYHIIQLIDKRGDRVNCRHILLKPEIPDSQFVTSCARLDSIAGDIRKHTFTFEAAARTLSDDKDTRNNNGLMNFYSRENNSSSARVQLKDLNADIAKVVDTLKVGEISKAFTYTNDKGQKVCAIVKLKERIDAHRANVTEDFQLLRSVVYGKKCQDKIDEWIEDKAQKTYVRIMPGWRNCDFKYKWMK